MERLHGQRRGAKKLQPDHLYSSTLIRGIVKNQMPNVAADGRIRAWSRRGRPDVRARGPRQRQLFEPRNEANNERGERGDNVGEQLLLSQPPARRLLLLSVPDRTGLALFDLPDAQTFELPAPGAPLSPSCHLASHLLGSPVPQKLFSGQLAAVGRGPAALRRIR